MILTLFILFVHSNQLDNFHFIFFKILFIMKNNFERVSIWGALIFNKRREPRCRNSRFVLSHIVKFDSFVSSTRKCPLIVFRCHGIQEYRSNKSGSSVPGSSVIWNVHRQLRFATQFWSKLRDAHVVIL